MTSTGHIDDFLVLFATVLVVLLFYVSIKFLLLTSFYKFIFSIVSRLISDFNYDLSTSAFAVSFEALIEPYLTLNIY